MLTSNQGREARALLSHQNTLQRSKWQNPRLAELRIILSWLHHAIIFCSWLEITVVASPIMEEMKKEEISGSMPTSAPRFSSLREKSIKLILLLKPKPTCGWLRLHKIVGVPPEGVLLHLVHLHLRVNLPTCHLSGRNIVKGTTDPGIACCGNYQSRARQHQEHYNSRNNS